MNTRRAFALAALLLLSLPWTSAHAGVVIGVGIPGPCFYRPHYHPYYYYGPRVVVAPAPVYVGPPPVYVAPAPVYVAPPPAPVYVQPTIQTPVTPAAYPPSPAPLPA